MALAALASTGCGHGAPGDSPPTTAGTDTGPADSGPLDVLAEEAGWDTVIGSGHDTADAGADLYTREWGGPGWPCAGNDDCDSGLCIEAPGGEECARYCVDACPTGYLCRPVTGPGGDPMTICVPRWARLCNPCTSSKECPGLGISDSACIDEGPAGGFCGTACLGDAQCPQGYGCAEVETVEGKAGKRCVRKSAGDGKGAYGVCPCNVRATKLGLQTTCSVATTRAGKKVVCKGTRSCTPATDSPTGGMLTACTAGAPSKEVCDGEDNDCDGDSDEGSCDDGNACTSELCTGKKGCAHNDLDAVDCDDGNACTTGDRCAKGACVPGAAKKCDDGNPCTEDTCEMAAGCTQVADDHLPCNDSNPCTLGDTCSAGVCRPGKDKECRVHDPCLIAKCNLADGKCAFANAPTGRTCDDDDACTLHDGCEGGVCKGAEKVSCDDQDPCTDDYCDGATGCATKPNTAACDDGNGCTVGDTCDQGSCKAGAARNCDDGNACTLGDACVLAAEGTGTCVVGKPRVCDDGNLCTDDSCDPKKGCVTAPKYAGACDADGTACTVHDACDAGVCKAGAKKACDDGNPCTKGTCNPDTGKCFFVPLADQTSCGPDGGVCKVATCIPGCKPEQARKCHKGSVWWFDSCGKPSKVAQTCAGLSFCRTAACEKGVVDGNYRMSADPDTQSIAGGLVQGKFAPVILAVKDWGAFVQGDFGIGGQKVQMTGKRIGKVWTSKGSYTEQGTYAIEHAIDMDVTFGVDPSHTGKKLPDLFTGTVIDKLTVTGVGPLGAFTWKVTGKRQ